MIRRAIVTAVSAALVIPGVQMTTASAAGDPGNTRDLSRVMVTTAGEFASVVRRRNDLVDKSVELDSHRFVGRFDALQLERLEDDPDVASVEETMVVSSADTQTDGPDGFEFPNDRIPWGLDRLDQRALAFDGSYSYDTDGTGVAVYVVDSGVNAAHDEFADGRVVPGWDYRQNSVALADYEDAFPDIPCGTESVTAGAADGGTTDQRGHGTHVAGTIVGVSTGVAKGATVIPVRALDCDGYGTTVMLEEALKWVVSHHVSGPAVVNMSLGVSPSPAQPNPVSLAVKNQISALVDDGISVVISAGNSSANSCLTLPVRYEADYPGVIGVAASDSNDDEADFTNWGDCVDLYAPGVGIVSAYLDPDLGLTNTAYAALDGTSMSAPHVSGAVARRLQDVAGTPDASPARIDEWIGENATRCAVTPYADYEVVSPNRLLSMATTPATPTVPCAPTGFGGTIGNRSASLSWTATADDGGLALSGYEVTTTPASSGCSTTGATSCTVSNLAAGQTYSFVVKALNSSGASRPSIARTGRPTGTPDAPVLSSTVVDLSSITVTWSAALGDSNTYTVSASPSGGTCVTTGTSCTFSGLSQGTNYQLSAVTTNVAGTSAASAPLSATTASIPAAPSVSSATGGLNLVTLTWSPATGATSYVVKNAAGRVVCTTNNTSCTVTGLAGGVAQTFTVESVNSFGSSVSQQVSAVPDAQVGSIKGVTVKTANRSLVVSWTADAANEVTYTASALGTSSTCTTTTTSCTLTGLTDGRTYNVVVVGANRSSSSATATAVAAYVGFNVKATSVKRNRRVLLTAFVVPVSSGKRTWSEVGSCRISGKYLITPSKKTTCKLTLKTAKTKTTPATSITLRISIL